MSYVVKDWLKPRVNYLTKIHIKHVLMSSLLFILKRTRAQVKRSFEKEKEINFKQSKLPTHTEWL